METPLVSVLVTSYNREKYIDFAIQSILAQTFTDYEIIVCDNCSTDNTMACLEKYRSNPKIRIYQTEKNIGQFPNRNWAASLAKGKYLKYVDSDDYIYPHGLEILVSMMEQFPDAGWGLCSLIQVKEKPYPFILNPKQAYEHNFFGPGLFHKAPLSSIIKKSVFDESGGFNNGKMVGDYELWLRLAQTYPVLLMPDGIVWYREHDGQEAVFMKDYIEIYEQIKIFYLLHDNCPLNENQVSQVFSNEKKYHFKNLVKSILSINEFGIKESMLKLKLIKNKIKNQYPNH